MRRLAPGYQLLHLDDSEFNLLAVSDISEKELQGV